MTFMLRRAVKIAMINQISIPQTIPSEIDNVRGIKIIVIKAGSASKGFCQSIYISLKKS